MKTYASLLGLWLLILLVPAQAEAKGVPVIYNSGDHVFPTGPLPAPLDQEPGLAGYEAGYMCQVKGVMWTYFSVSDCKPVAFKGDTYVDDPEVVKSLTAKYTEADMQRGLWGRFGWMAGALVLVAGALVWLKEKISGEEADSEDEEKA